MIRAIRGAITVEENDREQMLAAAEHLLRDMMERNGVKPAHIASILISATSDLNACFPAAALRNIEDCMHVPIMCMQEMDVSGALEKCLRVMMTVATDLEQHEVHHVYLEKAIQLRPDLQTH
ncbi:chorismate mutase [Ectobacillus ponti]|uniref:chorismate mutase n=1 Tax=Ectobacillus ponti TaxID=2961894 RepID=A0AA41X4F7_9BACI|nr:chorismate mutase [Ectobacillus ponti]MCP8968759.1 chorismate mutase [Ectobacillus ponti]